MTFDCDDLGSICMTDTIALSNYIEEIVVSAISYHLMNTKDPEYRNGKLVISATSLSHGLCIFQEGKSVGNDTMKLEAKVEMPKDTKCGGVADTKPDENRKMIPESKSEAEAPATTVSDGVSSNSASKAPKGPPDNEFEKRMRQEVIPPSEINVI